MFEDYYLNNPELQGLLAAAAGAVANPPRQTADEPVTQEAEPAATAPLTLAQLAARVAPGRDPSQREQIIASQNLVPTPFSINNYLEFGNGQGVAGGTPATTGLYAGHNYTLVDNKTGTILAQGSTPEEIQKIQDIANNLNSTQGKDADWRLYDANPESGITNMHEKMPGAYLDLSTPGDPRGVVVAGNMPNNIFKDFIIPALTPIALAAGAYFGGGALLGQTAGGGAAGAGAAGAGAATGTGAAATGAGLGTAATGAGLGAAATSAAPLITVTGGAITGGLTAAQTAALAAGLAAAYPAASALGGTGTGAGAGTGGSASAATPYDPIVVTGGGSTTGLGALPAVAGGIAPTLPALTELAMDPALMQPEVTYPDEEIVVTAPKAVTPDIPFSAVLPTLPDLVPLLSDPALMQPEVTYPDEEIVVTAPKAVTPDIPFSAVLPTLPALTELAMDPTLTGPAEEEIVVTGNKTVPKTVVPDVLAAIGPILPQLGIPQLPTPDPALTEKGGVLGTGLNVPQLISIGSVGADLLKNLLAGGGGTGAGVPYVSPFGAGAGTGLGLGTGQDMRANPTIADYERYGFGPEAMFFQPGYGLLNSAAPAPIPQAQPAMAINPVYQPLI